MAIREVGPGKTYPTIFAAAQAAVAGDEIVCFFDSEDTSFLYMPPPIRIIAADGYSPIWRRAGQLATIQASMTIEGMTIGLNDNGDGQILVAGAYSGAGLDIALVRCRFSFGTGEPAVCGASAQAVGEIPLRLTISGCSMAETTNRLRSILGVANGDPTQQARGYLVIEDSDLSTSGIRQVSGGGLFVEQRIERSILRISTGAGGFTDFAASSTTILHQSILDGVGTAASLMSADCSKTTVDVKNSYFMRTFGTAVTLTNCVAGDQFIDCAFVDNLTAISAANTVTDHCLFDNNTNDYAGGGALDATDLTGTVTFNDLANGDYSPTDLSDTIDAGIDVGFVTDLVGEAIPQGAGPDIGPYEHPAAPPPPPPPLAVEIDGVIRHLTTMDGGSIVSGIQAEIIPTVGDGPLNCIRRMLLVWAGTDKRCLPEELPHGQEDDRRRGWLGDSDLGNRLWLYSRAPLSTAIDDEIRAKTIEDLTWLTDGGFAAAYDVTVTHSGRRRDISVSVTAPDGSTATWAIDDLWTVRS